MKKLMLFAMWLAASTAAVGVAWAGVSVVDSQVVDPPSAADLASRTSDTGTSGGPATSGGQPTPAPNEEGGASPTADHVDASAADGRSPSSTPATQGAATPSVSVPTSESSPPATVGPTPRPAQSPSPSPTRSSPPPTTVPSPQSAPTTFPSTFPSPPPATAIPSPATTQTFTLIGGTTAISFSASGVQVLWATPNPGFDVKIEPESPGIKVEFRADHHRSRVDAWWSGAPQHSTREEPRD